MRRSTLVPGVVLVLFAGCAVNVSARTRGDGIDPVFIGTWKGTGSQSDMPGTWTIAATIADGRPGTIVGTITYPSLACGGDLILRNARPDRLELLEDITFGECVDQGIVTLTPGGDGRLDYAFRDQGSPATASGTLARAVR